MHNLVSIERILLREAYKADGTNVRLDVVELHVSLKARLLPEDSIANVTNVLKCRSAIAACPLVYTLMLLQAVLVMEAHRTDRTSVTLCVVVQLFVSR